MSERVTVNCKFHIARRGRRTEMREGVIERRHHAPPKPVPRISRLMALAIRFDRLIRDGVVTNFSELATLGHVTRARMTQVMNLLNLAPEIQEELLCLQPTARGRGEITEREMRPLAILTSWPKQRCRWGRMAQTIATNNDRCDNAGL